MEHARGYGEWECVPGAAVEAQHVRSCNRRRTSTITLANADSHFSEIERETGFRGSQVTITFLFYDLVANAAASETRVIFRGIGNTADEITESGFQVTFTNRLNLSRIVLPEVQNSAALSVDVSGDGGADARRL